MTINLYGGFGEKGRLSVGISSKETRLLFDIGIKAGATGRDYYPLIDAEQIAALDAVLISQAHEDHVGGLLWLVAQGFQGRILMTAETLAEAPQILKKHAGQQNLNHVEFPQSRIELFTAGDVLSVGEVKITTGRSGYVAGGVWFCAEFEGRKILYSGYVMPDSPVLEMDDFPQCDLLLLNASYGADDVSRETSIQEIRDWILQSRDGCLLPTPLPSSLFGHTLELMALMPTAFALHADMRLPLAEQIANSGAMRDGVADRLKRALHAAQDWREDQALPRCPLLTYDATGLAGPSAYAMNRAVKTGWPVLLTGHVPEDTPGFNMLHDELADWIGLPTHPTLSGMVALWEQAGKPQMLGHSCSAHLLEELAVHIPALRCDVKSGDVID